MTQRILVCGGTGFVGRHLMPRLAATGAEVLGGTRSPQRASKTYPAFHWVHADVDETASLERAMVGVDTLVYLVHHMRSGHADLLASERAAAQRVLAVAEAAGVGRIVYLGGPEPEGELSAHLQARLVTGEVLRSGSVSTLELRAGMVIGAEPEITYL
jgi:uncharacterized protein YbjT (DUF2867 family)